MPPKAKVTKDRIIDAAFNVAREKGVENISARTVAKKLKKAAYAKVDRFHTEYLMNAKRPQEGAMLGIGFNYIHFAIEEPQLFRFLFQSGFSAENTCLK